MGSLLTPAGLALAQAGGPVLDPLPLSAQAAREDLVLLREAVETIHPGLGRYVPAAEFERAWSELHDAVEDGTSDLDLFRDVSLLMAGLRCGHTRVEAPERVDRVREARATLLPFHFALFDGRMFVDSACAGVPLARGTEILAIDGTPVRTLVESIAATVPVDGWTDHVRPSRLATAYEHRWSGLDQYLPLFGGFRERFSLEVRAPGAQAPAEVSVAAATLEEWSAANPDAGWTDFVDAVAWRRVDEDTALLEIGTFVNYRRPVDPEQLFRRLFREMREAGMENLIVDLRACGGGSADVGWTLASFLIDEPMTVGGPRLVKNIRFGRLVPHLETWVQGAFERAEEEFILREDGWYEIRETASARIDPHPDRFRGRVRVLVGPYNASGSTMLLAKLSESGAVETIGAPTGGSAEGPTAGVIFFLTLPRSGVRVNLPVVRESTGVSDFRAGHGVAPDRRVEPTLEDFLARRDPVLAAALEWDREPAEGSSGSDWPHWRGPDRTGASPECGWVDEGKPLWVADVGRGYSSPSIASGRLFTRGYFEGTGGEDEGVDVTSCLDAETGAEIWTHATPSRLWDNMHGGGTLTTPAVDGDTVYVLSRMGPLTALAAADGTVRWERDLARELGVGLGPFGFCSSPLVLRGVLYVNVGKTVALDARTGATVWETRDHGPSYATPEPFELDGRELLAVFNAAGLAVLDREDGSEVALHAWTSNYNVNAASPIVVGNRIFISTGYDEKGCALLELTDAGLEPVWSSKRMSNRMNGCVLVDDLLFGFDVSVLRCLDLDGELLWSERGLGTGTLIASDGRLIVLSEEGELIVAPASRASFEPASRVRVLEDGVCWTTPVLAGGRIYCRSSQGTLVCRDHRPDG